MRFECKMCGHCCCGENRIPLNGRDVERIAAFTELEDTGALVRAGYIRLEEGPRYSLRFKKKPYVQCPFLMHRVEDDGCVLGLCELHPDFKPLVCRMAPLGRIYDAEFDSEELVVVSPAEECPGWGRGSEFDAEKAAEEVREELDAEREEWRKLHYEPRVNNGRN